MTGTFRPSVTVSRGSVKSACMRSLWPSRSESKSDSTHTSPVTTSVVEKTFCERPLTNVGTAGAGAASVIRPGTAATLFGGAAPAGLTATTLASAIVAETALALASRPRFDIALDPSRLGTTLWCGSVVAAGRARNCYTTRGLRRSLHTCIGSAP